MNLITELETISTSISPDETKNLEAFKNYYQDFFKTHNITDPKALASNSFKDIIVSAFLVLYPNKTCYILDLVSKYPAIFTNEEDFKECFLYIFKYQKYPELHRKNNNFIGLLDITAKISLIAAKHKEDVEVLTKSVGYVSNNKELYDDIKDLIPTNPSFILNATHFYEYLKLCSDIIENSPFNYNEAKNYLIKMKELNFEIASFYDIIYSIHSKTIKEFDKKVKEAKKQNKKILELISNLTIDGEIKNIDHLMALCPNEDIKNKVVDYVLEHNEECYKTLVAKLESLKTNNKANLTRLFAKYNYDYNMLDEEHQKLVMNQSYDTLENISLMLSSLNIKFEVSEIPKINYDHLKTIIKLLKDGYLNLTFISKHKDIMFNTNSLLATILSNIGILSDFNINIMNYQNSLEILLSPNLKETLQLLNEYNLAITKSTTNISFFQDPDFQTKLDVALELGILKDSLDLLNYPVNMLYNYKIAMALNIPLECVNITNPNYYESIIPTSILEEFKSVPSSITLPESLISYEINSHLLNIDGIIVSKKRFLNNLSHFSIINALNIFYSLIYNSYYTLEEINKLKEIIIPTYDSFYKLTKTQNI